MKTNTEGNNKFMNNTRIFLTLLIVFTLTFMLAGCSDKASIEKSKEDSTAQVISVEESLDIPINELTNTVQFYPVVVDDIRMEVLAVLDSDGNVRTAFNTCQICYSSGRGYYEQSGDKLICQNCGNEFTVDQIEEEAGGCNPWPIFSADKTVTTDTVSISYDFLKESSELFENWKAGF